MVWCLERTFALPSAIEVKPFSWNVVVDVDDAAAAVSGRGNEDTVNKVAKRVLIRLRQKLSGFEGGVQMSIAGQVNHLIQEASDPKNLCRLYPGWQPYL